MGAMLPGTFAPNDRAKLEVADDYVTAAKVTATKPRQVVTYTLNRKAKWSDGEPITWKDYAAQWKALRSAEGDFQVADTTGYERVSDVRRGKDDYEVVVTFSRPFGEWQALFNPLYPASTNADRKASTKGGGARSRSALAPSSWARSTGPRRRSRSCATRCGGATSRSSTGS